MRENASAPANAFGSLDTAVFSAGKIYFIKKKISPDHAKDTGRQIYPRKFKNIPA